MKSVAAPDEDHPRAGSDRRTRRRDVRWLALMIVALGIALIGYAVTLMPAQQGVSTQDTAREQRREAVFDGLAAIPTSPRSGNEATAVPEDPAHEHLAKARQQIQDGDYEGALAGLNASRPEIQHLPESYLLVGVALLGKNDFATARDFFNAAIDRDTGLAEAYFGFAIAAEGLGDLETALSGMRSFLHLQADPDPYRLKVAQARSAIWEWESKLGRGDWGPTAGLPPGFTPDEVRRDGRGAGTKIPIPGTADENGFSRYTIKHSDPIRMFEK